MTVPKIYYITFLQVAPLSDFALKHKKDIFSMSVQTVDKALLLQGFAIVGTAFLI